MHTTHDLIIVGGGIVGLATAFTATRRWPSRAVLVLEKEVAVGQHQSGRNSGVLHSGIYYKPGSQKALNCRAGKLAMEEFCRQFEVPLQRCGKVIVAVDERELPALDQIHQRGLANGVTCTRISRSRLLDLEPHAAGVEALHVPETAIVDFLLVCQRLTEAIAQSGGAVRTASEVRGLRPEPRRVLVETATGTLSARCVVNCAGLQSDRVAAMGGLRPAVRIVPFRGEYYELRPTAHDLCRNLIYPVPDPRFPFLGVHFTRLIQGGVECGPNAVWAWAREGYTKTRFSLRDTWDAVSYPGFLKLAVRYWRTGLGEMVRSVSKRAFVHALQRLVPDIRAEHLVAGRSGVRAQAVAADGSMVDDFLIQQSPRIIHVLNAPSPAATSALNIAQTLLDRVEQSGDLEGDPAGEAQPA
ncbi:MAG: L-2-hydroxyglutarate oxidase [Pirellulaceae bacterium]|jgi:L-2-hydroxyglutarate oxidase|nr:L-2-hydroxyglutarate oxidase [Pirellulaceae bacterium]